MSDTPRTDKETGKSMGSDSIVYASFARQLERELTETCKRYEIACETAAKMHAAAVGEIKGPHIDPVQDVANVRRERDEYRGLLIELYNDINVIHSGKAVSKLNKLFRDENYN
jgi:hypothetical protein